MVIAGKDKGKIGNVRKTDPSESKVIVEGANMVTKAQKPNPMAEQPRQLIDEAPLVLQKWMCASVAENRTRIKHDEVEDKKIPCL